MTIPSFFKENASIAPLTTFGVGGKARWLAEVTSIEQMQETFDFCRSNALPWIILGKGSNTLFADEGFNGIVILCKMNRLRDLGEGRFLADAGYSFARLGSGTARGGWTGLEFASGIPGSVGGAVYMNAGANGSDTASVVEEVVYLHWDGTLQTFTRHELAFGYRHSPFQVMRGCIVSATFTLKKCAEAKAKQHEMLAYRTSTQPYGEKSAGCVFRNPEGFSAGGLIDKLGLKGYRIGGAVVSPMHANFIVNEGGATAKDILALMEHIRTVTLEKYGIELRSEVCYISDFSVSNEQHLAC